MYEQILNETTKVAKDQNESEEAKTLGNAMNEEEGEIIDVPDDTDTPVREESNEDESYEELDLEDLLGEIDNNMYHLSKMIRSAIQKADSQGGEVSRVVGGQLQSYLLGTIDSFRNNEGQPGSIASLQAFLEDRSNYEDDEEEYDEQNAIERGETETPIERVLKENVNETDGETLQYRKDQLAQLKMNPDTNFTPSIKISDNYVGSTNYLSITAREFVAIKNILENGVSEPEIEEKVSREAIQRMEGLVPTEALRSISSNVKIIIDTLMDEGFDELEIKEWLTIVVNQTIVGDADVQEPTE